MKLFAKTENETGVYYSSPVIAKYNRKILHKDEITKDVLASILDKVTVDRYPGIGQVYDVSYYTESTEMQELVELPHGAYTLTPRETRYPDDLPQRLIPTTFRKDEAYIPVVSCIDKVNEDIEKFLGAKSIFEDLKFPYRRGYLLYGPPGNGKTALIRELTKSLQDKCMIIWVSSLPSPWMAEQLSKIDAVKIFIFEEIVEAENNEFSTKSLLTFLDGEHSVKNSIVIATTNYPEKLKANLANRPSRFDIAVKIDNPSKEESYRILSELSGEEVEPFPMRDTVSFASLKEMVLQRRLHKISWQEAMKVILDRADYFNRGFEERKQLGIGFGEE